MTPEKVADWYARQDGDWHCAHCRDKAVRLLGNCRNQALEEAAKFVEENYEEPFTNVVGNQSWRERGPKKLAAAIRALKDYSPQQDSN